MLRALLDASHSADFRYADRLITYVITEAANLWTGYCRAFYLSCALGVTDSAGVRIRGAQRFTNPDAALRFAIATAKPLATPGPVLARRDEPVWHDVGVFLKIMTALGPPNVAQVGAALSLTTDPLDHLQAFRNFYAHRNEETVGIALRLAPRYGAARSDHPTRVLTSYPPRRAQTVLDGWLTDRQIIIELMA